MPYRSGPLAVLPSVLIVAASLVVSGCNRAAPPPAARPALTVTVTTGRMAVVPRELAATGDVVGWQEAVIAPEIGGVSVRDVLVDVGDRVHRGQELVRLSTGLLAAEEAARAASLRQAEADQKNAAAALRRGEAIVAMGALSEADLDRLRALAAAAVARVDAADAELAASRTRLGLAHIRAPDDGVITSRQAAVGQVVQVGTELMRFLRRGRLEWRAEIPESQAGVVKPGQRAVILTPRGRSLKGTVRSVGPWVQRAARTSIAYVDLDPDPELMSGMFARGSLLLGEKEGRLVPAVAVVNQDGYSYVFVLGRDNRVERRRIATGVSVDGQVEIVAGLKAAERIVDRGAGFLKDGDLVRVVAATP